MGGEIQGRGSAGVVKNDVRTLSDKGTIRAERPYKYNALPNYHKNQSVKPK
jgi:hypothetical protein